MKKLIPLLLLLLSCNNKPDTQIAKVDQEFRAKDSSLIAEEAQISIESKKASVDIVQAKKSFKQQENKVLSDSMPAEAKADVVQLIKTDVKKDSSFENKIRLDSLAISKRDTEITLLRRYSENLHQMYVSKADSLEIYKTKLARKNKWIKVLLIGNIIQGVAHVLR